MPSAPHLSTASGYAPTPPRRRANATESSPGKYSFRVGQQPGSAKSPGLHDDATGRALPMVFRHRSCFGRRPAFCPPANHRPPERTKVWPSSNSMRGQRVVSHVTARPLFDATTQTARQIEVILGVLAGHVSAIRNRSQTTDGHYRRIGACCVWRRSLGNDHRVWHKPQSFSGTHASATGCFLRFSPVGRSRAASVHDPASEIRAGRAERVPLQRVGAEDAQHPGTPQNPPERLKTSRFWPMPRRHASPPAKTRISLIP